MNSYRFYLKVNFSLSFEVKTLKRKKWILKNPSHKTDIFDILARSRGFDPLEFKTNEEIEFDFLDPYLLLGMDKTVERIFKAIEENEKIYIYGDYDVDGISSVSILLICFLKLGVKAKYYIPQRIEEGYGINKEALKRISEEGTALVISVDCGITSLDEVSYAKELGMDIIITDHHQCKDHLPDAFSIINPKQPDCNYPYKELCGAGIAFKLAQALLSKKNIFDIQELLEISAVATVADIVSLTGENRIIVQAGLSSLENPVNLGLKGLIQISGITQGYVDSSSIAFILAPRINSSGRMGKAGLGVSLLMSESYQDALNFSKKLEELNRKRQSIELEIYEEALEIISTKKDNKVLIAASDKWHSGVIGIVASKITEKYHKPTIIIAIEEGVGKGSARSIEGFNLFSGLSKMDYLLEKFGGHEQAAGITILPQNMDEFEDQINNLAQLRLSDAMLYSKINIDAELFKEDITFDFLEMLSKLEPFGMGNSKPVFCMTNIIMRKTKLIGKTKKHIKGSLNQNIEIIGFNMNDTVRDIDFGKSVDIAFEINKNIYMGKHTIQLLLKDIKQSYVYKIDNTEFKNKLESIKNKSLNIVNNENIILVNNSENLYIDFSYFDKGEENRSAIIIFDYRKAYELIKQLSFRNIKYQFELSGNKNNDNHTLIIMPFIDNLDLSIYNSIIICEDEIELFPLQIEYNKKVKVLSNDSFNIDTLYKNNLVPSREILVKLYSIISQKKEIISDVFILCSMLNISLFDFFVAIEIFYDVGLIGYVYSEENQNITIRLAENIGSKKKDLESAEISLALKNYYQNILTSQGGNEIGIERQDQRN